MKTVCPQHHAGMTTPSPRPSKIPRPRLWGWLLMTLVLLAAVWLIAPQQLPVSLYKLSLVTLAAVVGYWLDRSLFPYARPDTMRIQPIPDQPCIMG